MKRDKTIQYLVTDYRFNFHYLERPLLRKLIRLENPDLFKNKDSNLKTLDRWLKKSYLYL